MSDGKIHIPARRKQPVDDQMVVKVTPEAYNALVEIYNESTLSLKQIARQRKHLSLIESVAQSGSWVPADSGSRRTASLCRQRFQMRCGTRT